MKLISILSALVRLRENVRLVGELFSGIGRVLTGAAGGASDSGQDSLTLGVENEEPEDAIQYDLFDESDSYESSRPSRSKPDNERHSPKPSD